MTAGGEVHRSCRWCKKPTPVADLNNFGGRCGACYGDFCRAPQPPAKCMQGSLIGPTLQARRAAPPADEPPLVMPPAIPLPPAPPATSEDEYANLPPVDLP